MSRGPPIELANTSYLALVHVCYYDCTLTLLIARRTICMMQDIRIERWAHTLVHYSLYIKARETVAIHATPLAAPLVEAVYREILRTGAHPVPLIDLENLEEILLRQGSDAQLTKISPVSSALVESIDARLSIGSRSNTKALSGVEPDRTSKRRRALQGLSQAFRKREQAGNFRWSSTLYPTTGYAQDAEMSLHDFEKIGRALV